jgi:hypothetical protein
MGMSDAENGEQESTGSRNGKKSGRPGQGPASDRPVPTPAEVFRRKRPATPPAPAPEAPEPSEEDAG